MINDLYWTLDGDFCFGPDGDLRDTSFAVNRSVFQECRTRVRSNQKDWELYPNLGASLGRLLGKLNTRATAEEGKVSIISSLTRNGFIPEQAIKVNYIPLTSTWLFYKIIVNLGNNSIVLQLLYDTAEDYYTIL